MPRRFAVAAWEQLEALHSEWSARTQEHVGESAQCQDPLAQRGRQSGLTKDMLNEEHRWAPTPGPVLRQVSPGGWYFLYAGIFKFFAVLPYDVSEIVASSGISP